MVVIKTLPDGFIIRTAESDDKEGVSEIEAFGGDFDYVAEKYDEFMANPDYHLFVGELHGKVIAFCFVLLLDEGQTVMRGGKRIHQDFRRQGYLAKFIDPVEEYVSVTCPGVKQWVFVALNTAYQRKLIEGYREAGVLRNLGIRHCFFASIDAKALKTLSNGDTMKKISKDYDVGDVIRIETKEIPECFLDPQVQADLFPDNLFDVGATWDLLRPTLTSFQHMMHTVECYITYSGDASTSDAQAQRKVKAVSFVGEIRTSSNKWKISAASHTNGTLPLDEQLKSVKQHIARVYTRPTDKYELNDEIFMNFNFPRFFSVADMSAWLVESFPGMRTRGLPNQVDYEYTSVEYDWNKWAKIQKYKQL